MSSNENDEKEYLKDEFERMKIMLESMELDLRKNINKGNVLAGRRVRAGIRELKEKINSFNKRLIAYNKSKGK